MGRRLLLGAGAAAALWLFGVWPPPLWWRSHWPRRTAMMRLRAEAAMVHPTALADIAPVLQRMVILAEDSRFRSHIGIDPVEMRDALELRPGTDFGEVVQVAWRRRSRLRGASTITQQLAKNLYLSPTRNPLRKVKEIATALRLEAALPKDRILELYLNVAEWGTDVWGAEAASREYFATASSRLTVAQAAALAATLPHPRSSNPLYRPARMERRQRLILARYFGADVLIPPGEELDTDSIAVPPITLPIIPPAVDTLRVTVPTGTDTGRDTARPESDGPGALSLR